MAINILYSTDGEGHWSKREWSKQCEEKVFMYGQCQGVEGHKGVHWCYGACGSFEWDDNDDDPTEKGCAGSTPPDHKFYKHPIEMQPLYWLSNYTDTEITNPEHIEKLEKDEVEEGASITRPVDFDSMEPELREELEKRLKDK